jgi:hypothetical protein
MYGFEKWQNRNGDVHDQVRVFRQVSEPMRHENHRPTFSFLPEVGKESVFGFRIEGRAGLVYSNELYGRGEEAHERARTESVMPIRYRRETRECLRSDVRNELLFLSPCRITS